MTETVLIALYGVAGSILVAAITAYFSARGTTKQTAATMYNNLCTSLAGRVENLEKQRDSLEAELADRGRELEDLRQQMRELQEAQAKERVQWQAERAELQTRIDALEAERAELKAQLAALQRRRVRS